MEVCGSSLKIEIDPIQPLKSPCRPNIVRKDKEWIKDKSKWQCKIDNCTIAYICCQVIVMQTFEGGAWFSGRKGQIREASTSKGGPWYQNHVKMNVCILQDAVAM